MRTKDGGNKISVDSFAGLGKCASLQNRRNFLRILGEQRRKRGERGARVPLEGKSGLSLARDVRLALPSVRLK